MKRILITGSGSYIGRAFGAYMGRFPEAYRADAISLRGAMWRTFDFSPYDVILHTAGLAHVRETARNRPIYYAVNRDLTVETAKKAKAEGMRQFIFLSSMSVYGLEEGVITPDTVPRPRTSYGKSKLEAENQLREMETPDFHVAILRPPMVYGEGCKGNYQALVKLAKVLPVCPDYENRRSMLSIERLCGFIKWVMDEDVGGLFCPQDPEYVCTCRMICELAGKGGREIPQTRWLNFVPALLRRFTKKGKKAFGSLVYQNEGQCGHAGV